jgi:hypothetical protein
MSEKKEQKIVVFITFTPADNNLILNGIKLASVFKKKLCLVYRMNSKNSKQREVFNQKLIEYTVPIKKEIPTLKTSVLLLKENIRELPDILADDYEAILLIANAGQFKKLSKAVTESPVPFLFIKPEAPLSEYKKIVLPVDLRKENSDSILWSSWFGRFNQSEIIAIAANEKSRESQKQVARNITLAKKLYLKFKVSHKLFKGRKTSLRNSFEALEFALAEKSDLLILLGSSVITPLDSLIGLPERKIIRNAGNLPVLLVNPRRDNYILCD